MEYELFELRKTKNSKRYAFSNINKYLKDINKSYWLLLLYISSGYIGTKKYKIITKR